MYLIFDTETTGLPKNWRAPISDTNNWPRCVQIAWQLHDELGNLIESNSFLIKPDGYDIPYESEKIHGISTQLAELEGEKLENIVSKNIKSEGITKGSIQIPGDGKPIILLSDHPTIGGYPKIANVITADYDKLVQKTPNTKIKFKLVDLTIAESAFREYVKKF